MAINKAMRAALKALSYPDLKTQQSYPLQRTVINITHKSLIKPLYHVWDHKLNAGDHEIPMRIFSPEIAGEFPILLFFHGGGWVTGNIDSYDSVCANLAKHTSRTVVSVDYRLAPEHKFPAGLEDCYLALQEVAEFAPALGGRTEDITLIGDSAGGNLAAAVSLLARDRGGWMPKRQVLLYPATWNNHTESSPFPSVQTNGTDYLLTGKRVSDYMALYKSSDRDLLNPYFAPLLMQDLTDQPDTLVITAEYDPLRDEGEAYGERLEEAGNYVEIERLKDALHGFISLSPRYAHVKQSYFLINRFLNRDSLEITDAPKL